MSVKKFDNTKQQRYLGALKQGLTRTEAARVSGVSYPTVWAYGKANPAWLVECEEAEIQACDPVENKLRELALAGNLSAILVWLYNRSGGRWADRRVTNQPHNRVEADDTLKAILE